MRSIRRFFRDIKIGIRNIFVYFNIIYADRDWDHYYFTKLIEFKMRRMEKYFSRKDIIDPNSPRITRQLRKCIELFERMEAYEYCNSDIEKTQKEIDILTGRYYNKPIKKGLTGKQKIKYDRLINKWIEIELKAYEEYKLDGKRIMRLISKYYLGWWD